MTNKSYGHSNHMASVSEIVAYWSQHQDESGLAVDWAEAHKRCWACGRKRRKRNFDRCHIVPQALGGPDSADNLVLLCPRCHKQAPNVKDPSFMWFWLRSRAVPFYDTEWIISGLEEYQRLFGRRPFCGPDPPDVSSLKHLIKKFREQAIVHFSEGRPNPSTLAWIIAKIEDEAVASSAPSRFTRGQSRFARLAFPLEGEVKKA